MTIWDEDAVIDLVRIEASERTVRGWVKSIRVVREKLFTAATRLTNAGDMKASVEMLDAYSGLAHLDAMLKEGLGKGRE